MRSGYVYYYFYKYKEERMSWLIFLPWYKSFP